MPLDQVQVAILTLLRGQRPRISLGANPAQLTAGGVRRLELVARGVTLAAEVSVAVVAAVVAVNAAVTTPAPTDSIDAEGFRRLAMLAAIVAVVAAGGAAAALRWRHWFWRIQLAVGCGVAAWYVAFQGA